LTGKETAAKRAAAFESVRAAHQTETAEDYVELIQDLSRQMGEARLVDVASHLGVSHATASKVLARLQREGLILSRPYRGIFLTEQGHAIADKSRRRHRIVKDFLLAAGLPECIAAADSEGLEHHCSEETLAVLERLTARLLAE
jgi:DtxR family transcriptional regulator, manganese transport regulator